VTLLDARALVAFLADEPGAGEVGMLLRSGETSITTINLAEAVDVLARRYRVSAARTRQSVEELTGAGMRLVDFDPQHAWRGGELRARHYHRRSRPVSVADCSLLAAAARSGEAIATADGDVLAVARAEGIGTVALPDSSGRRAR